MEFTQSDIDARVQWIRTLVKSSGAKGVALGLSGGKDSAVVAALVTKAEIPLLGVNMPIHSVPEDIVYVRRLERILRSSTTSDIEVLYLHPHQLGDSFAILYSQLGLNQDKDTLVLGNMKARLRMLTIYAFANKRNYLVAGTGNASEAYVGYFTKWGDGAHDFNPISDLHVSEVIGLGKALGLGEIVDRIPSAGLWEGQTDESELGVTYAEIEAVAKGYAYNVDPVHRKIIEERHIRAKHKLEPIPTYADTLKQSVCV